MTVFGYTTWLYNITLENIDIEYYNALLITASTDQVIYGIGVVDRHITQDDNPLDFVTGLVLEVDTFASSMSISSTTQQLCFGIATEDVMGIHSTVTLTFTNQIVDEENKLKFTQINNGTELSVSALDETISGVVTIPSSYNGLPVTQIESGTASSFQNKHVDGFAYCDNITEVIIPETVREIASCAFYYCNSVTTVEIPIGVTSIGSYAFRYCSNLTSIEIPSGVTSIGSDAFSGCFSLTSIEIPSSVTSIGDDAFSFCYNLTSIEIPSSVTSIGDSAFNNCDALETVTFGDNSQLESIGEWAFSGCSNLTSIKIPSSVTSIGDYAFRNCSALETVTFKDTESVWVLDDTSNTEIAVSEHTPQELADYLTSNYYNYTWTKKQSA